MTDKAGLYLHIPFCEKKCRYCSFYSAFANEEMIDRYTDALIRAINQWGGSFNRPIDTVYLGGGTPSLLVHRLPSVLNAVKNSFDVSPDSEITLEMNPQSGSRRCLEYAKESGINRLSIGAQSGNGDELSLLGRSHTVKDTENTFNTARNIGFKNISLDIMIGLPGSDEKSLFQSLSFISELYPEHISAYILKIEDNTAFMKLKNELPFPDDDHQAEQYISMCRFFENNGYSHYEISNFAKEGNYSRHNTKYWRGAEYLGIGPSAHSFLNGKRFFYRNDLKAFISGDTPLPDGDGGGKEEFVMLRLRLKEGIVFSEYENLFGEKLPYTFFERCRRFEKAELMILNETNAALTDKGMLLSNSIITELLECEL